MLEADQIAALRVEAGAPAHLHRRDPGDRLGLSDKAQAVRVLEELHGRLRDLQARLWADRSMGVLVVLQSLDAGGKDGTIRSVFTGVNPQGVRVASFRAPTDAERAHDYLWRVHAEAPPAGEIVIFNRSHYEDVLAVRVHQLVPETRWRRRYRHIREFERMLVDEGVSIVKVHLHVSKDEQKKRLEERIADPAKRWKFRRGDLEDRARWHDYGDAYEEALTETSTDYAPWYVVPADHESVRNVVVARLLVDTLEQLNPRYPPGEAGIESMKID